GRRAPGAGVRTDAAPAPRPSRPGGVPARGRARAGGERASRSDGPRSGAARTGLRGGPPRGDRDRPAAPRSRGLPLADARTDRGGPLVALGRGGRDLVQGGGLGVDAVRRPAPAGLGRPARPEPWPCEARDARSVPAAAREGPGRVPLRATRERLRDPRVRGDRHAADDHLPLAHLLSLRAPYTCRSPGLRSRHTLNGEPPPLAAAALGARRSPFPRSRRRAGTAARRCPAW